MKWIKKIFITKYKKCKHPNFLYRKYLSEDNTPMIYFRCNDCGYIDAGHVYANPEEWPKNEVVIKNNL